MYIKDIVLRTHDLEAYNISLSGDVVIPGFVTERQTGDLCRITALSESLFKKNADITSVTIPPTVKHIERRHFMIVYV